MIAFGPRGLAAKEPPQTIDFAYFDEAYFYGAGYRDYDRESPPRKLEFYSKTIERAVANVDRPRVLDVGCAFGRLLAGLPPYFDRVGIDVSVYALEEARRFVDGVRFVQAELPPESLGRFDAIAAFDVLQEVADPQRMLRRIADVLAPGGTFVAVVPVYDGPFGWAQHLVNDVPTRRHQLSRAAWLDLIAESFAIADWQGVFRFLPPAGPYVHAVSRNARAFAPAIVVRAAPRS